MGGIAAFAAAVAACNAIAGLGEDFAFDPKTGSGNEGGTDGERDSGKEDSATAADARVDGASDSGPAGPFCSTVDASDLAFCADFEGDVGVSPFGFTSTTMLNTTGATYKIVPTGGAAGTSAGLEITAQKGATSTAVWIEKLVEVGDPNKYAHYEAAFDFVDVASPITYTALGILTFDNSAVSEREHGIGTFSNGTTLSKLSPQTNGVLDEHRWHHAVIRLDRPSAGAPFTRYLEISEKLNGPGTVITWTGSMGLTTTGGVELRLGTFNTGTGTGQLQARFDNVVVRKW